MHAGEPCGKRGIEQLCICNSYMCLCQSAAHCCCLWDHPLFNVVAAHVD